MDDINPDDDIISLSKNERKNLLKFIELFKKQDNYYSFNFIGSKEKPKHDIKQFEKEDFYTKYINLSNSSGPDVFELEKELANYIKNWHSIDKEYKVDPNVFQDYFFNEENVKSKSARFCPVYPDSTSKNYIELRTYSVDDVELFEKNVLFNTYAIMWSQAQKKVSEITWDIVTKLQNNDVINNTEDLMQYFENNNFFKDNQDLKSKRIAVEFIFMQISVLRAINDYNEHFIDNELFWQEILQNLSEGWKDFLYNFLLSGQKETIGFEDRWWSSLIVKKYTNLNEKFNATEYLGKSKPITSRETKKILDKNWNSDIDEKWIPYITNWINKKLLWETLCIWCQDTQKLEDTINNKISNIDRIKSYIIWNDKGIKIDRQYLYNYFKSNMSLEGHKLYHPLNTEFANKIINLNNFFLKEDDTNANCVLQTTILNWDKEAEKDISKSSMFETWYMRKWYNYYQWWSENMLIHTTQRIALNYMENVKNILNSNTPTKVTS